MDVIDLIAGGPGGRKLTDPHWAKTPKGKFHRLLFIDPVTQGLSGVGGVFVAWHGGLRPRWLYVGKSGNLAHDLDTLLDNEDIMAYDKRGGVFVTWALIRPEYQDGVLRYLIGAMKPEIEGPKPAKKGDPIPVLLPGHGTDGKEPVPDWVKANYREFHAGVDAPNEEKLRAWMTYLRGVPKFAGKFNT